LRRRGISAAVVDVDVVYEIFEPRGRSSGTPTIWRRSRRLAGRIANELHADGVAVVFVEAGFLDPASRADVAASADLVVLRASVDAALHRVRGDEERGISKDERLLRRHYAEIAPRLASLPPDAFVLDTTDLDPEDAGREVAAFATTRRDRGA
jgi:hypothetical protein